jgi:hypothetical protein
MALIELIYYAKCLTCDWTPDPTRKMSVDSQADKHTRTAGHATSSWAIPARSSGQAPATSRTHPDADTRTSRAGSPPIRSPEEPV